MDTFLLRDAVTRARSLTEAEATDRALRVAEPPEAIEAAIATRARRLAPSGDERRDVLDRLLGGHGLSSAQGLALLCLAEALPRIPDAATADQLLRERLPALSEGPLGWGRTLAMAVLGDAEAPRSALAGLIRGLGGPGVRTAARLAVGHLAERFVAGEDIDEAIENVHVRTLVGVRHSFDMLGEGARSAADAGRFADAYAAAIVAVGKENRGKGPIEGDGVSVKLSALHPRFEEGQRDRVLAELLPRLAELARLAREHGTGLTIDAEEADRLELTLDLFERLVRDPGLQGWDGLGLAVQAYQLRSLDVVAWLIALGKETRRHLCVRLVKGAYWDTEIRRAQVRGLDAYPVFTRGSATDVAYIACARRLLAARGRIFPQFASHNPHTIATVLEMSIDGRGLELQRLHGMGDALAERMPAWDKASPAWRIYAPVGRHADVLPYLVRRLIENGANGGILNRLRDGEDPGSDPRLRLARAAAAPLPAPCAIVPGRPLAPGLDPGDLAGLRRLSAEAVNLAERHEHPDGLAGTFRRRLVDPADPARPLGSIVEAAPEEVGAIVAASRTASGSWRRVDLETRAACLDRAADRLSAERDRFAALVVREAGKTLADAAAEVREATDLLRLYATEARRRLVGETLPAFAGERGRLEMRGHGVFAAVSPWNFPLAIFLGQAAAALVAGNAVVAKPAPQTPLVAAAATRLLHAAGVPADVLRLIPGGPAIGEALIRAGVDGIVFTGSTATARAIRRALAEGDGPLIPFIAETGGVNALFADGSTLPEQLVDDVVAGAFGCAGQRCSAVRLLVLQDEIAPRVLDVLAGAMAELRVGDPAQVGTDVGPLVDPIQQARVATHVARLHAGARPVAERPAPALPGHFVGPVAFEIEHPDQLGEEIFGPVLHVVRTRRDRFAATAEAIRAKGYALTGGIHTRVAATRDRVAEALDVGSFYVNRGLTGAVPGMHPFGGHGLSGTGPKAGGGRYVERFAREQVIIENTAAIGADPALNDTDPC